MVEDFWMLAGFCTVRPSILGTESRILKAVVGSGPLLYSAD